MKEKCPNCDGKGKFQHWNDKIECISCKGTGKRHRNYDIMGRGFCCSKCGANYNYAFNYCPDCGYKHSIQTTEMKK